MPDTVNSQITDSVEQANLTALGESPAQALGSLYQVAAHSTAMALQNAVATQQNANLLNAAIITQAIKIVSGNA